MLSWAAGISPQDSDDWTWGELLNAVMGWQERIKTEQRGIAILLYRYGLAFTPGEFKNGAPEIYEIFPLWNQQEINQMKVEEIKQRMYRHAAQHIEGGRNGRRKIEAQD